MTNKIHNIHKLYLSIKSVNKTLFDSEVQTVTSVNERGVFDILPLHTNFITLIKDYVLIDKNLPTETRFNIDRGVLYVLSNRVYVYRGI